jgi:hypothetical protein
MTFEESESKTEVASRELAEKDVLVASALK